MNNFIQKITDSIKDIISFEVVETAFAHGKDFFQSSNGVWLAEEIEPRYINLL